MHDPMDTAVETQTAARTTVIFPTSRAGLVPFFSRPDGEDEIVAFTEAGIYMSMPPVCVDALHLLDAGYTVDEVGARVCDEDGLPLDMEDLVATLNAAGVIRSVDGYLVPREARPAARVGLALFTSVPPSAVRWLWGTPALIAHGAAFLVTALLLWSHPRDLPTSRDFTVLPWYAPNLLVILATVIVVTFLHELGHLMAARAVGVSGRLSLSRRLFALVAQCELEHVYQAPRARRVIIYLAGMIVNVWIGCLCLLLLLWPASAAWPLVRSWLHLILLICWSSTTWQFRLYMQTDVYFIVSDLTRARNLMGDATLYLSSVLRRLRRHRDGPVLAHLPRREQRVVHLYALCYSLGVGVAVGYFAFYYLPFLTHMALSSLKALSEGPAAGIIQLSDALVTLGLYAAYFAFLARSLWRAHGRRIRRCLRPRARAVAGAQDHTV